MSGGLAAKSIYAFRWKHTVPLPTSIPTRTTVAAHAGQGDSSRNSHASKALPLIESGHHEKSRKISAGRFPIGPGALCAWRPANSARTSSARRVLKHPQARVTSTLCTSRMLAASLGRIAGIHPLGSAALTASAFEYWRSCSSENGPTQAPPRATANNVTSTLNADFTRVRLDSMSWKNQGRPLRLATGQCSGSEQIGCKLAAPITRPFAGSKTLCHICDLPWF
jgi:hypothetical protein